MHSTHLPDQKIKTILMPCIGIFKDPLDICDGPWLWKKLKAKKRFTFYTKSFYIKRCFTGS